MPFSALGEDKMSTKLLGCPALSAKTLADPIKLECMQVLGKRRFVDFCFLDSVTSCFSRSPVAFEIFCKEMY